MINTCSVRERAEEKLYTRLGELRDAGRRDAATTPSSRLPAAWRSRKARRIFKRSPGVADVIVGTQAIRRLPMLVEAGRASDRGDGGRSSTSNPYDDVTFPLGVTRRGDPVKAYVTIIEGCNEFCSFCVVPYTRGHERMRPKADILAEVREAADSGHREVQLLGQIVNHYQAPDDPACDFTGLLEAVHEVAGIERIRFASPHPRHVLAAVPRGDARAAEGLPAPAPAGAVGLDARARGDAAALHARELSRARRRASARRCRTSRCRPI